LISNIKCRRFGTKGQRFLFASPAFENVEKGSVTNDGR